MASHYRIRPEDRVHVDEYRRNPVGHHSPGLNRVLTALRAGPLKGKHVLIVETPHAAWRLGVLSGARGRPVKLLNKVFHDLEEAEWEVFKRRWKAHTGETLREPLRAGEADGEG